MDHFIFSPHRRRQLQLLALAASLSSIDEENREEDWKRGGVKSVDEDGGEDHSTSTTLIVNASRIDQRPSSMTPAIGAAATTADGVDGDDIVEAEASSMIALSATNVGSEEDASEDHSASAITTAAATADHDPFFLDVPPPRIRGGSASTQPPSPDHCSVSVIKDLNPNPSQGAVVALAPPESHGDHTASTVMMTPSDPSSTTSRGSSAPASNSGCHTSTADRSNKQKSSTTAGKDSLIADKAEGVSSVQFPTTTRTNGRPSSSSVAPRCPYTLSHHFPRVPPASTDVTAQHSPKGQHMRMKTPQKDSMLLYRCAHLSPSRPTSSRVLSGLMVAAATANSSGAQKDHHTSPSEEASCSQSIERDRRQQQTNEFEQFQNMMQLLRDMEWDEATERLELERQSIREFQDGARTLHHGLFSEVLNIGRRNHLTLHQDSTTIREQREATKRQQEVTTPSLIKQPIQPTTGGALSPSTSLGEVRPPTTQQQQSSGSSSDSRPTSKRTSRQYGNITLMSSDGGHPQTHSGAPSSNTFGYGRADSLQLPYADPIVITNSPPPNAIQLSTAASGSSFSTSINVRSPKKSMRAIERYEARSRVEVLQEEQSEFEVIEALAVESRPSFHVERLQHQEALLQRVSLGGELELGGSGGVVVVGAPASKQSPMITESPPPPQPTSAMFSSSPSARNITAVGLPTGPTIDGGAQPNSSWLFTSGVIPSPAATAKDESTKSHRNVVVEPLSHTDSLAFHLRQQSEAAGTRSNPGSASPVSSWQALLQSSGQSDAAWATMFDALRSRMRSEFQSIFPYGIAGIPVNDVARTVFALCFVDMAVADTELTHFRFTLLPGSRVTTDNCPKPMLPTYFALMSFKASTFTLPAGVLGLNAFRDCICAHFRDSRNQCAVLYRSQLLALINAVRPFAVSAGFNRHTLSFFRFAESIDAAFTLRMRRLRSQQSVLRTSPSKDSFNGGSVRQLNNLLRQSSSQGMCNPLLLGDNTSATSTKQPSSRQETFAAHNPTNQREEEEVGRKKRGIDATADDTTTDEEEEDYFIRMFGMSAEQVRQETSLDFFAPNSGAGHAAPHPSLDLPTGAVAFGEVIVIKGDEIGRGANGVVFRAERYDHHQIMALKEVHIPRRKNNRKKKGRLLGNLQHQDLNPLTQKQLEFELGATSIERAMEVVISNVSYYNSPTTTLNSGAGGTNSSQKPSPHQQHGFSSYDVYDSLVSSTSALPHSGGATTTTHNNNNNRERNLIAEINLLRRLHHPNLIAYYGSKWDQSRGVVSILMECADRTLRSVVKKFNSHLKEDSVAHYARQVLQGLEYLHENHIIHRDIKAENVLVTSYGDAKLSDFGLSKLTAVDLESADGTLLDGAEEVHIEGTPLFMAPEIVRGGLPNEKSDIWAFGCLLIELISGRVPWSEKDFGGPEAVVWHLATTQDPPPLPPTDANGVEIQYSEAFESFYLRCVQIEAGLRPSVPELLCDPFLSVSPKHASSGGGGGGGASNASSAAANASGIYHGDSLGLVSPL